MARRANSLQTGRRDLRLAGSDVPHPTCSRPVRRFRALDLAERALSSSPKRSLESRLPSVGAGVAPPPKWSSLRPKAGQEGTHTPARSRIRLAPVAAGGLVPGERGTLWAGAGRQRWPRVHRLTPQRLFTSLKQKRQSGTLKRRTLESQGTLGVCSPLSREQMLTTPGLRGRSRPPPAVCGAVVGWSLSSSDPRTPGRISARRCDQQRGPRALPSVLLKPRRRLKLS